LDISVQRLGCVCVRERETERERERESMCSVIYSTVEISIRARPNLTHICAFLEQNQTRARPNLTHICAFLEQNQTVRDFPPIMQLYCGVCLCVCLCALKRHQRLSLTHTHTHTYTYISSMIVIMWLSFDI